MSQPVLSRSVCSVLLRSQTSRPDEFLPHGTPVAPVLLEVTVPDGWRGGGGGGGVWCCVLREVRAVDIVHEDGVQSNVAILRLAPLSHDLNLHYCEDLTLPCREKLITCLPMK